jgi:mRNA interferase MazF
MTLPRGSLVLVDLESTRGHEQRGTRPCLVVSDPAVNASQRFPLIAVVPITGTPAPGALYHQTVLCPGGSAAFDRQTAGPSWLWAGERV